MSPRTHTPCRPAHNTFGALRSRVLARSLPALQPFAFYQSLIVNERPRHFTLMSQVRAFAPYLSLLHLLNAWETGTRILKGECISLQEGISIPCFAIIGDGRVRRLLAASRKVKICLEEVLLHRMVLLVMRKFALSSWRTTTTQRFLSTFDREKLLLDNEGLVLCSVERRETRQWSMVGCPEPKKKKEIKNQNLRNTHIAVSSCRRCSVPYSRKIVGNVLYLAN